MPCNKSKLSAKKNNQHHREIMGVWAENKKTKIRLILICSDLQLYQVYTFHCWQGADNCISSHVLRGHPIRGRYASQSQTVSCRPHFNHPGWPKQCLRSFRFSYLLSLGLIRQSPISSWTMIVKWSQGALSWMIVMDCRSPNQMTVLLILANQKWSGMFRQKEKKKKQWREAKWSRHNTQSHNDTAMSVAQILNTQARSVSWSLSEIEIIVTTPTSSPAQIWLRQSRAINRKWRI